MACQRSLKEAGVSWESLYGSLRDNTDPALGAIIKVMDAWRATRCEAEGELRSTC